MSWMDQIGNILQQYGGTGFVQADPPPEVDQHFDQIVVLRLHAYKYEASLSALRKAVINTYGWVL